MTDADITNNIKRALGNNLEVRPYSNAGAKVKLLKESSQIYDFKIKNVYGSTSPYPNHGIIGFREITVQIRDVIRNGKRLILITLPGIYPRLADLYRGFIDQSVDNALSKIKLPLFISHEVSDFDRDPHALPPNHYKEPLRTNCHSFQLDVSTKRAKLVPKRQRFTVGAIIQRRPSYIINTISELIDFSAQLFCSARQVLQTQAKLI